MDVGQEHSGGISASMNMSGQLGSFLSSVAFGYAVLFLKNHHFSMQQQFNLPVYPLAAMLLVSGLLFLLIDPTKSLTAPRGPKSLKPLSPAGLETR
jgi:fructose-specific phosphotransferase system IIC component